jgi:hypothetical protein
VCSSDLSFSKIYSICLSHLIKKCDFFGIFSTTYPPLYRKSAMDTAFFNYDSKISAIDTAFFPNCKVLKIIVVLSFNYDIFIS